MSSNIEVYKKYFEASWANPPSSIKEANEAYLSDDFQTFDKDGNMEMDKQTYTGSSLLMTNAFDDFKAVYGEMVEQDEGVIVSYHFEGTHTGDLDLSAMGMGVIPASGKRIVWPEAKALFTIKGDKITSIRSMDEASGMGPFLAAITG